MQNTRSIYFIIFISSLSCLVYEITLLRIFSITLWHNFAFMVISIAMLGIGASGTMLSIFPGARDIRFIPTYALLMALFIPVSYILNNAVPFDPARLSWDRLQIVYAGLYSLALSVPFFWFGLIIGTSYSSLSEQPGLVYASDLIGAGTGSLAALLLMFLGGPEYAVFICPLFICLVLWLFADRAIKYASSGLLIIISLIIVLNPGFMHTAISPYKPLNLALAFPGAKHISTQHSPYSRIDVIKSPAARYAPGLSLRHLEPLPEQTGISIDAGEIHAMTDEGDEGMLVFVKHLPSGLPYLLSSNKDVLVLEPKAGLPVLTAQQYNAENIYAVDSNPLLIKTVQEHAAGLSSGIYRNNTWTGLGRSWLMMQNRRFDVIDFSLMGAIPSGTFGFSEDYRLTKEAVLTYITHLKQDGFLSVSLYIIPPLRAELRLIATLAEAMESLGIENASAHTAAVRSWGSLTVIIKRSPLSVDDISRIKDFSEAMRFDLIHYPGIRAEESNRYTKTAENEDYTAFLNILDRDTRAGFIDQYIFDIRPVDDNRPFFHYYLRLGNIKEIYRIMGEKWQFFIEEGYLLPLLFVQAALLSLALIILPVIKLRKALPSDSIRRALPLLSYFCLLGAGYMSVMLMMIQKMVLLLEHPAYAASTVIAAILISSGLGGFMSRQIRHLRTPQMLPALAGVIALYGITLPLVLPAISVLPLYYKILTVFMIIMPLGFLMGLPLPLGISILGRQMPWAIPWAWAANAFWSVLSPILAVIIALEAGFQPVTLGAAALYALGYLIMRRQMKSA